MRQLDLNLPLSRLCALYEDVQDQLRAIDDFEVRRLRKRAHLRRLQLAVEDQQVRAQLQCANQKLVELAAPEHRARIDRRAPL